MDVKNAFLNRDLKEEVYMIPRPSVSPNPGEVWKLKKALYMVLNKPLDLGLRGFLQWLLPLVFILVLMIRLFLLSLTMLVVFFFHFMLMT